MTWSFLYPNLCFNHPALTDQFYVDTSVLCGSAFVFSYVGFGKMPRSDPVFTLDAIRNYLKYLCVSPKVPKIIHLYFYKGRY